MKALTEESIGRYDKLLKNIIDIPLFEVFLNIGVELIEMHPEEQYITELIEVMQEKYTIDSIEEFNMKFRQVQDYYNDVIATYENTDMFDAKEEKLDDIDKVVHALMLLQNHEENMTILKMALIEAVETVAYEFGCMDELYGMDEDSFRAYVKKEVFAGGAEGIYINYISMLDMRNMLIEEVLEDERELYVKTVMFVVNISVFNDIRKERFKLDQEKQSKKVGRNEPCPCGSGKKYKKCCG